MRLGRLFGTEIRLHFTWFILVILFILPHVAKRDLAGAGFSLAMLVGLCASVLFHEFAHILTARQFGAQADKIVLHIFGGAAYVKIPFGIPEAVIGIAGPIFSFIVGVILLAITAAAEYETVLPWNIKGNIQPSFLFLIGFLGNINLILAAFNMLPIFPMDGGRIVRGLLTHFSKRLVLSTRIVVFVGLLGVMPIAFGTFLPMSLWTMLLACFVAVIGFSELHQVETLYSDEYQSDPNKLNDQHVAIYVKVVEVFGPDHPLTGEVARILSSPEFDVAANNICNQARRRGAPPTLGLLWVGLRSVGIEANLGYGDDADNFIQKDADETDTEV